MSSKFSKMYKTEKISYFKEVKETECKDVEVTKFKSEIKNVCKTKQDQACNVTMKDVPTQECLPSEEEK